MATTDRPPRDKQPPPEGICVNCGRPLDDHMLHSATGAWLSAGVCLPVGEIAKGIKRA